MEKLGVASCNPELLDAHNVVKYHLSILHNIKNKIKHTKNCQHNFEHYKPLHKTKMQKKISYTYDKVLN